MSSSSYFFTTLNALPIIMVATEKDLQALGALPPPTVRRASSDPGDAPRPARLTQARETNLRGAAAHAGRWVGRRAAGLLTWTPLTHTRASAVIRFASRRVETSAR